MYTVSGGYCYDRTSFIQKKPNSRKFGQVSMMQISAFLFIFILSFVFGAVIQAYATNDVPEATQLAFKPLVEATPLYETHIVESGQSLWVIAKQHVPTSIDIRLYVNKIISLNQLDTNILFEGQRLLLP